MRWKLEGPFVGKAKVGSRNIKKGSLKVRGEQPQCGGRKRQYDGKELKNRCLQRLN